MSDFMPYEIPHCFVLKIRHKAFDACFVQLLDLVRVKTSTGLVIVTGPTGAGKTTLRECLEKELEKQSEADLVKNPEHVAFGSCAVKPPGLTAFSWKDTHLQMLKSLRHPFLGPGGFRKARIVQGSIESLVGQLQGDTVHHLGNDPLFRALQKTVAHRRPKALIFDEAHHLLRITSAQSLVNQLEHLKYMADETDTLLILFGTYELTRLMDLSSALIRRREVVHFPRYIFDPKNPRSSLLEFGKVGAVFAKELDVMCEFELLGEVPYFYQGSVGCVGVFRDWLFRSFCKAKETGKMMITRSILQETILVPKDRSALLKDCLNGEIYFADRLLGEKEYWAELGFEAESEGTIEKTPHKKKTKPFTRSPHNDPVGVGNLSPKQNTAA